MAQYAVAVPPSAAREDYQKTAFRSIARQLNEKSNASRHVSK